MRLYASTPYDCTKRARPRPPGSPASAAAAKPRVRPPSARCPAKNVPRSGRVGAIKTRKSPGSRNLTPAGAVYEKAEPASGWTRTTCARKRGDTFVSVEATASSAPAAVRVQAVRAGVQANRYVASTRPARTVRWHQEAIPVWVSVRESVGAWAGGGGQRTSGSMEELKLCPARPPGFLQSTVLLPPNKRHEAGTADDWLGVGADTGAPP